MSSSDSPDDDVVRLERRRAARRHVILRAKIIDGTRTIEAVMLDLSQWGAQLQITGLADLPQVFLLRQHDGAARKVRQRWRAGQKIGVEFLPDAIETPTMGQQPSLSDIQGWVDRLRNVELAELFHRLDQQHHFASQDIREASRDLGLAVERLRLALLRRQRG